MNMASQNNAQVLVTGNPHFVSILHPILSFIPQPLVYHAAEPPLTQTPKKQFELEGWLLNLGIL